MLSGLRTKRSLTKLTAVAVAAHRTVGEAGWAVPMAETLTREEEEPRIGMATMKVVVIGFIV